MRKLILHIILVHIFLSLQVTLFAQSGQYNINVNNGLPSNHVYYMLKDKNGYLWISTDKGVARYNGYEFKLFDLSAGISNDDIWHLYEDRKERIWLSSITNELGYIRHEKYHKVIMKSGNMPLYPVYITEDEKGILFLSLNGAKTFLCREENDTVTTLLITLPHNVVYLQKDARLIVRNGMNCYWVTANSNCLQFKKCCSFPEQIICFLHNTSLVPFPYKSTDNRLFSVTDIYNGSRKQVMLNKDENIYMLNEYNGNCYLTSNKHVYKISNKKNIERVLSFDEMKEHPVKGNDVLTMIEDDFWGKCIATNANGLYVNYYAGGFHNMHNRQLSGFRYVGDAGAHVRYWWNKSERMLARYSNDGKITFQKEATILDIRKIVPYDAKRSVLLTDNNIYWLINDRLSDFYESFRRVYLVQGDTVRNIFPGQYQRNFVDGVIGDFGKLVLANAGWRCAVLRPAGDSLLVSNPDNQRYSNVAYDPLLHNYIAYNKDAIFIYNGQRQHKINYEQLLRLGIKKIEQILIDSRYGNMFVKCNDRLLACNIKARTCKELYRNYNLSTSLQLVRNDTLIVSGKFGVLYSTITGPLAFSPPVVYRNIKNTAYDHVSDIQYENGQLLLNTDKGLQSVAIPADSTCCGSTPAAYAYRFLTGYHDHLYPPSSTITVAPRDLQLRFDVINPAGNGPVRYRYLLQETGTGWQELGTDRLQLPALQPGRIYTLSVIAYDDAWKSDPADVYITITPYWWQTGTGRKVLWIAGILFSAALIITIVQVTKSIVTRRHAKAHMQLELSNLNMALELKSIYAQINPHFIFNTLSTALYFIKKKKLDDAYTHVSAFSDLLRAYIKSSRNKFISIAEETENLENYIRLQQARFEQKFVYSITVDPSIPMQATKIPSLLLQPLVENAINHGLLHKEDGMGHLDISFTQNKVTQTLTCIIADDGIGREKAREYRTQTAVKTPSYGNELIRELINIFNRDSQVHIDLQYTDRQAPQTGTVVTITIKTVSHEN